MKDNEQQRGYDIEQGSVDDGERNGEGGDAKEIESCTDMQQIRVNVATGVALYAPIGASDFPHRNENEIEHAGKKSPFIKWSATPMWRLLLANSPMRQVRRMST